MLQARMARWLPALVLGGAFAWASVASAQSFALEWSAPADCPSADVMRANIAQLLARSQAPAASVQASGTVKRKGARWALQLTLDVQGETATRALSAADCSTLSDTAAWMVAIAVDPRLPPQEALAREGAAAPSPTPTVPTNDAERPPGTAPVAAKVEGATREQPEDEKRTKATEISWHFGIFSGVFAGGLAGPSPSLGARVSAELDGVSLDLGFAHHFATGLDLTKAPARESVFSAQELALSGCYAWGQEVRVGPCAVLSGLRVNGNVEHIMQPSDKSVLWSTLGASLALSYRGSAPWELFADGGLWLPLSKRPRFEVQGLGPVGQGASWGGRVRFGVGVILP